jgi:hypothetical protein
MREVIHEEGHRWQRTSVVDEEAIDHEREIAVVEATGEVVRVRVAQRVDFDLLADPVTVQVSPPRITVGQSFEMTPAKSSELGEELINAGRFAQEQEHPHEFRIQVVSTEPSRPRLVAEQ